MTIFLDIDGTILEHLGSLAKALYSTPLPGTLEKLDEWYRADYKIILITGRRESMREQTVNQLARYKIHYDLLLMGLDRGPRVVINDLKETCIEANANAYRAAEEGREYLSKPTAYAFNLYRNEGIQDIEL